MTITYSNPELYFNAICEFVKRGMTFKSDGDLMTITFTGGY